MSATCLYLCVYLCVYDCVCDCVCDCVRDYVCDCVCDCVRDSDVFACVTAYVTAYVTGRVTAYVTAYTCDCVRDTYLSLGLHLFMYEHVEVVGCHLNPAQEQCLSGRSVLNMSPDTLPLHCTALCYLQLHLRRDETL